MQLDVRRLRVLREIALRGTLTAAADALGYTPSAVSQQLSALERETGTALVERRGRSVRLTEAARLLVARTEPVLVALEEARAALEEWQTTLTGELAVAASGSVAAWLVNPVAAQMSREHPRLRVTVRESEGERGMVGLRLGELDLIVAHEYEDEPRAPEEHIVRVPLLAEDMLLAAPSGWLSAPTALAELAGETWVAEPPESACGRAFRSACRAAGFEPDVRYTTGETSVALATVARAGALSLVPRLGAVAAPAGVAIVPLRGASPRRRIFAAHRPGSPLRPALALMLERLGVAARADHASG